MIEARGLTKKFGAFTALRDISCKIPDGSVYGLVGSNGAGKSTLMRLMTGVYSADGGSCTYSGEPVFDNPAVKGKIVYIADELFFLPQSSISRMAAFYQASYPGFSREKLKRLADAFGLDMKAPLNSFSKGMRRQAAAILALSTCADYLFLDETFDGLDPVMRQLLKRAIYECISERGLTVLLSSHSLRELEDTCDQLALLHKGGIVFQSDVDSIKTSLFKVQAAFAGENDAFAGIEVISLKRQGAVVTAVIKGDRDEARARITAHNPLMFEILPLSLEEYFIYEMERAGYGSETALFDEREGA